MTTAFSKVPKGKPLAFGDRKPLGGPTLEQARQQMIEAAEFRPRDGRVPSFIQNARAEQDAPPAETANFAPDREPAARTAAPIQPTRQPAQAKLVQEPLATGVETEPFHEEDANSIRDIRRDGRDWIATIQYRNGAGTETFRASNYRELLMKILTGKGHATLKIRAQAQELSRGLKEGFKLDNWADFQKKVLDSGNAGHGISRAEYEALPEGAQSTLIDVVQSTEAAAFMQENPSYVATPKNLETIIHFLNKQKVPITSRNLGYAFSELKASGKLETKANAEPTAPGQAAPASPAAPATPQVEVAAAPQAAPRKRGSTGIIPGSGSFGNTRTRVTPSEVTPEQAKSMPLGDLQREMRREAAVRSQGRR